MEKKGSITVFLALILSLLLSLVATSIQSVQAAAANNANAAMNANDPLSPVCGRSGSGVGVGS